MLFAGAVLAEIEGFVNVRKHGELQDADLMVGRPLNPVDYRLRGKRGARYFEG